MKLNTELLHVQREVKFNLELSAVTGQLMFLKEMNESTDGGNSQTQSHTQSHTRLLTPLPLSHDAPCWFQ